MPFLCALLLLVMIASCKAAPNVGAPPVRAFARAPDGVPIAYESRGSGDCALVFVHCWAGSREFWHHELDRFASRYRVVALDLGGHGESGVQRTSWSVVGLAADVQAVCDELGLQRMILIGHSMGGPIALAAAARMKGRVRGVIGVDTLHDADVRFPREILEQYAQGYEKDFEGTMEIAIRSMMPADARPEAVEWIVQRASRTPRAPAIALLRDFANVDLHVLFQHAGAPVRCINKDPFSSADSATAVETNRRYADFDVIVMKGVGHYPMIERPDEFDQHLEHWLAELDGR